MKKGKEERVPLLGNFFKKKSAPSEPELTKNDLANLSTLKGGINKIIGDDFGSLSKDIFDHVYQSTTETSLLKNFDLLLRHLASSSDDRAPDIINELNDCKLKSYLDPRIEAEDGSSPLTIAMKNPNKSVLNAIRVRDLDIVLSVI